MNLNNQCCLARIKMGAKSANPIHAKVRNIKISSRNPTNPNNLSGIKSTGSTKYTIASITTLKKCRLLIKSIQNLGSLM
jgi:hypothetical protein